MDAGKSFLLGMWGFVWVDGLVSFLLEVVLGRMKYKKKVNSKLDMNFHTT